jgi:hypothetical protein
MIKTMTAQALVPHFGYCDEIVFDEVIKLRNAVKSSAAASGVNFSYLPVVIKAVSLSLLRFPQLNAKLTQDMGSLEHFASHNIGANSFYCSLHLCRMIPLCCGPLIHESQGWLWQHPPVLLFPTSKMSKHCRFSRLPLSSLVLPDLLVVVLSPLLI